MPTIAAPAPGEAIRSGTVATAAGATAAIGERVTLADLIRMTTDKQREAKREASRRRRAAEHAAFGRHAGGDEDEETMQTGDAAATLGLAAGPLTIPVDANGNDIVLPRQNAIPRAPPGVANAVVSQPTAPPPIALPMAPQVHVVNGRLVVNQHSLTVVQPSQPSGGGGGGPSAGAVALVGGAGALSAPAHYSNGYANRTRVDKWSTQDTALFYRALSQFGTDFSLIERLFPGRTRRQIKNKFTSEEKVAPQKVDAALRDRTGSGGTGAGGTTSVQALRDMIDSLRKSQAEEQARQERLQQAAIAAAAKQASDAAAAEQAAQGERDRQVAAAKESRREAAHARAAAAPPVVPSGAAVAVPPPPVVKARGQQKNASVVNAVLPKKVQRKQRANLLAEDDDCGPAPAPAVAAPEVAHQAQAATAAVRPGKARDMPERLLHGRDAVEAGQQAIRNALAGRMR